MDGWWMGEVGDGNDGEWIRTKHDKAIITFGSDKFGEEKTYRIRETHLLI